jgi:long-chain acyl-CoA synthetase
MLSHDNLAFAAGATRAASHVEFRNRSLVPLPLSHAFGLMVTIAGYFSDDPEGFSVLQRWFEPSSFLSLVQEHRVQSVPVVPSMLQALLAQPLESYDLASLESFGCGAAPVSLDVVREIERRIPSVTVREGYGCTETAAGLAVNPPDARRLGSVGRPLPGVEVRIVDDRDEDVPAGSPGEVCCRSRAVMAGYWGAPELTSEALRGGWFHTGDIGRLDEDGYLWIVDRKKDLIIRGGFNVFPRDVEDALLEHPAVAAAGVVGRPDERMGEEVVAFVVPRSGCELTPEDVVEFARTRLGGHRYPRDVRVVDRLPLTTVGKLDRKTLRERIAE